MNEKERDQLIRDTFDQCLSGIDTMPSLRPVVNKQLDGETPKVRKHIPLRRIMVPAAALALCVCLIVTGNYLGMFRWPDIIREPETRITASPVPLAQPEGKDGEGASSADDPGTPSPDSQDNMFSRLLEGKVPLNAVCEKAGIRFKVHSAEVYDNYTRILCSMQDLEGGRITVNNLEYYPHFSQDISVPFLSGFLKAGCVREEYRAWYFLDFWYDGIDDPSDRTVTISAENMPLIPETGEEPEWIRETWSVEIPLKSVMMDQEEHPAKYSEEFFAARLKYTVNDDGTATVVCPGDTYPYLWDRLVIPEKLDGRYVTAIADSAFEGFFKLESVTLPDTVISIGAKAFSGCYNLESADLPFNLESIGDEAFSQTALRTLILPDTLQSIGKDAFGLNYSMKCVVTEGSFAQQYCMENGIDCTAWVTVTGTAPDSTAAAPAADTAEWTDWGTYDPSSVLAPETGSALQEDQYDERMMEIYTPLDQFIRGWELVSPLEMLNYCVYDPVNNPDEAARTWKTVSSLSTAISPSGRFIEDALDLVVPEDNSPVTVSVIVTDIFSQAKFRFNIRFVRQADESWRIDPASLETCEKLDYIGRDVTGVLEFPDLLARSEYSDAADHLQPVSLSCEKDGFRLDVRSAAVSDREALVLFSLTDTENRQFDWMDIWPDLRPATDDTDHVTSSLSIMYYDAPTHTGWYMEHFRSEQPVFSGDGEFSLVLQDIRLIRQNTVDLMPYLREYGGAGSLAELPDTDIIYSDGEEIHYSFSWEDSWEEHWVLDYTRPLDITLTPHTRLTGIGFMEDGLLHVQVRSLSGKAADINRNVDSGLYSQVFTCSRNGSLRTSAFFRWETEEDGIPVPWTEYQVPCKAEILDSLTLELKTEEIAEYIHGSWTVTIPSGAVRSDWATVPVPALEPESVTSEDVTLDLTSSSEALYRAALIADYPELADMRRIPLHISCEDQGIRLEIVSAGTADRKLVLFWTLEDREGRYPGTGIDDISLDGRLTCLDKDCPLLSYSQWSDGEKTWYSSIFSTEKLAVPEGGSLRMSLTNLRRLRSTDMDLSPLYAEYGGQSALTDAPETGFCTYDYDGLLYRPDMNGQKVLDSAHSLAMPLEGTEFLLGGIGLSEDGTLHVQLYTDSLPAISDRDVAASAAYAGKFCSLVFTSLQEGTRSYLWQRQEGGSVRTYNEFQVPNAADSLDKLTALLFAGERIEGTWEVDLPTEQILPGEPG